MGITPVHLLPFSNTRINDVVGRLGGPLTLEERQVTVRLTDGLDRVGAILSVVDNTSQEPTTLSLVPR